MSLLYNPKVFADMYSHSLLEYFRDFVYHKASMFANITSKILSVYLCSASGILFVTPNFSRIILFWLLISDICTVIVHLLVGVGSTEPS